MSRSARVSVAIPVHNEESVLPELLRRLRAVLDTVPGGPHQIVLVDDGSTDGTLAMIEEEAGRDDRILGVALSRNFGHQAALSAALDYVRGDVTIVMDGDLQDAPEVFPAFIEKYFEGNDVVYAQRTRRKESWALRVCYFLFYRVLASLSDVRLPLDSGDFGLMSRRVVEHLRRMPEHHRYLRGLRSWVGFRQAGIEVERAERHAGRSKYSFLHLVKLASDGLFAFSIVPIRAAAMLGAVTVALVGLFALYSLYAKFILRQSPRGFTAEILLLTFLSGVLLFFLGIIGEYVGRVYEEVKARPHYIVGRLVGNVSSLQQNTGQDSHSASSASTRV
ncbi:MAG: glycosyltransferase family 2 protein [Candidatus Acidiferrales bacterium]|jgi:dolichol-phosphate mannosyltransferase